MYDTIAYLSLVLRKPTQGLKVMHALREIACQMYKIIATRFNTAHWKDSEMTEGRFGNSQATMKLFPGFEPRRDLRQWSIHG